MAEKLAVCCVRVSQKIDGDIICDGGGRGDMYFIVMKCCFILYNRCGSVSVKRSTCDMYLRQEIFGFGPKGEDDGS